MIKFKQFLLENRLDFIKSKNPTIDTSHDAFADHRDASSIIDHFANRADPSPDKKYTQWIVGQYKRKHIRQEDHPHIREVLSNFEKHRGKLENKDINSYSHISHVQDSVAPHLGAAGSRKEEKRQTKADGADLIHDGPNFTVHHVKTEDAACLYGANTKWCTAAKKNNKFDHYNSKGPLYVIQNKHTGEKHQFHFGESEFKDAKDRNINLGEFTSKNPELSNVKPFRDSKYGALFSRTPEERKKKVDDLIDRYLSTKRIDHDSRRVLKDVPLDDDQIGRIVNHGGSGETKAMVALKPNATPEHVYKVAQDPHIGDKVMMSPKLNGSHIDNIVKLMKKDHYEVPEPAFKNLARNPNLEPRHIDYIVKRRGSDYSGRADAALHPNADPSHIKNLLSSKDPNMRKDVAHTFVSRSNNGAKIPSGVVDRLVNDSSSDVRDEISEYKGLEQHHVDKLADDILHKGDPVYNIIGHPKLSSRHIDMAVDHEDPGVREHIAFRGKLKPHHIDILVDDEDYHVRGAVAGRSDLTAQHRAALEAHGDDE